MFAGPIVGLFTLMVVAIVVITTFRAGVLTRNLAIGIRTRATLASDNAWDVAHRRALPYLLAAAVLAGVFGTALLTVELANLPEALGHALAAGGLLLVLLVVLLAGLAGARAARAEGDPNQKQ